MHDVVVVGGGGSGVPLAVRLAARGASVLLLEAGPADLDPLRARAATGTEVLGARAGHPWTLGYDVSLRAGHPWRLHRGRVLGGSTAVNGGYFVRARRADFAEWAEIGGSHWSYDAALPLLRALETDLLTPDSPVHGGSGPIPVDRSDTPHPLADALTAAALDLGAVHEPDKNDQGTPGIGPVPRNVRDGRRISTAIGYLSDGPPGGLELRGEVRVLRIRIGSGRAVGVETDRGFVPAGQVVLCAGAVGTAHLLMLSGVGPAADLRRHGIGVHADLPVGGTLSDHPQVMVERLGPATGPVPADWLGGAVHTADDLELLQSLVSLDTLVTGGEPVIATSLLVSDLTPAQRGRILLRSPDPDVAPLVELGHLGSRGDRAALRTGVRRAVELLGHPGFGPGGVDPGLSARTVAHDDLLDDWIARHLGTAVHTCGTAPMGAVTDGDGRVLGLSALSVADTSVLPRAPRRGPANTAVLVGELLARRIGAGP